MNSNLDLGDGLTPGVSEQQPVDVEQSLLNTTADFEHGALELELEIEEEDEVEQALLISESEPSKHWRGEDAEGGAEGLPYPSDDAHITLRTPPSEDLDADLTMKDLFGAYFEIDKPDAPPLNPLLEDTRGILTTFFGPYVSEEDIILGDSHDALSEAMRKNKDMCVFDDLVELFGEEGAHALMQDKPEAFNLLYASLPEPRSGADAEQTWLVEMPNIAPNRQILHADPRPFLPSNVQYLESDSRMLYTPSNLIRWAYHKSQQLYMSNARVVRWSDHSLTLHVGSDVHSLLPAKENAPVSLLGSQSSVRQGGVALPAVVTTLYPDQNLIVESSEAASIERAVLEEGTQRNVLAHGRLLPYTMRALPEVEWSKPKSRNPLEEFVMLQYEQRQKELDRRLKEGRPMTLKEQLDLEQELLTQIQSTSVDGLFEQKQEALQQAAVRARAKRTHANDGNQRKFQRELGLMFESVDDRDGRYEAQAKEESGGQQEQEELDAYESLLKDMESKRRREDDGAAEERRQQTARHEKEFASRFAPLLIALENLAQKLPMGTDAYGSVDGTVEFIRSGVFAPTIVAKEVPVMLQEVAQELPDVDTTAVRNAFRIVFPHAKV